MNKANIQIHPRQTDVTRFYNEASIVLNLSDKDKFIETFGLTALEAMSAGLPVIVPTVGGIAEMVEDGVNGYRIDVGEVERIRNAIERLLSDRDLYAKLSQNALRLSQQYNVDNAVDEILRNL